MQTESNIDEPLRCILDKKYAIPYDFGKLTQSNLKAFGTKNTNYFFQLFLLIKLFFLKEKFGYTKRLTMVDESGINVYLPESK